VNNHLENANFEAVSLSSILEHDDSSDMSDVIETNKLLSTAEMDSKGLSEKDSMGFPSSDIISITVINPGTRGSESSSYVVYTVETERTNPKENLSVERRYRDFVWLHESLRNSNKGIIIPPLPKKSRTIKFSIHNWGVKSAFGRFSVDFIKKRERGLELFLKEVVHHKCLGNNNATQMFLSAPKVDIKLARISPERESKVWGMFVQKFTYGSLTESLGRGKHISCTKDDHQVNCIKARNKKSTGGLEQLINALMEIQKREEQMSKSWLNIGVASQAYSKLIAEYSDIHHSPSVDVTALLRNIASGVESISNLYMIRAHDISLTEPLLELKRTGPAVEAVLQDRKAKLCEAEALQSKLKHKTKRRDSRSNLLKIQKQADETDATLRELTLRVIGEWESFYERKVDTLKFVMRSLVEREIEFHQESLMEFQKLKHIWRDDEVVRFKML